MKVLVTDHNIRQEGIDRLRENGIVVQVLEAGSPRDVLIDAAQNVDGMLARGSKIMRDVLLSPNLQVVSRHGVGFESVDVDACTELGVAVCISGDANSQAVSEHAFCLLLACARNVRGAHEIVMNGTWARGDLAGIELYGKTLGIVGIGRIGSRVARQAAAFGMRVLACDPYVGDDVFGEIGAQRVDLETLLSDSDFVTLHCPLNDQTFEMIGAAELDRMKPTSLLINAARGELIDEPALHTALTTGQIAAAGLDVFHEEPPSVDHPLFQLDNVVCSPHIAGQTEEALIRTSVAAADNILSVFRGEEPDVLVNRQVLQNGSRISWKE